MRIITSIHNEEVKLVAALKNGKDRDDQGRFIAEGQRVVSTFVEAQWKPTMIYTTDTMITYAQQLVPADRITSVSHDVMKKMSQATTPSGILAVFRIPPTPDVAMLQSGLVMANLSDPGNVGTLMRTCAAMKVPSVVMVEGVDPWHPKVIQASAGAISYLKIFQMSWQDLIAHKSSHTLYALTVSGGKDAKTVDATHALLVVGNEAHGLPAQWIADCGGKVTIAMPGKTESLNVAIAGSIALYEVFGRK